VKRLCADDSAATSVKVGYRQANYDAEARPVKSGRAFCFSNARKRKPLDLGIGKCATNADAKKYFAGAEVCKYGSISLLLIDASYDCQ
jgi:hypothetical protein